MRWGITAGLYDGRTFKARRGIFFKDISTHEQSHNEGALPNRSVDLCTPAEQRFLVVVTGDPVPATKGRSFGGSG
jgi:hypothetical protein